MTVEEFFLRPDNTGCRHIVVPGGEDTDHNHIIFHQRSSVWQGVLDVITMSRGVVKLSAQTTITREDMQLFLDMKIGISDLWKRGTKFMIWTSGQGLFLEPATLTDDILKRLVSV